MKKKPDFSVKSYEKTSRLKAKEKFVLHLYISGTTPQSQKALSHVRKICEERLLGRYQLQVIDIYQNPELAKKDHIVAVPTLLKLKPAPLRRLIGDLSDESRVMAGLGIFGGRS